MNEMRPPQRFSSMLFTIFYPGSFNRHHDADLMLSLPFEGSTRSALLNTVIFNAPKGKVHGRLDRIPLQRAVALLNLWNSEPVRKEKKGKCRSCSRFGFHDLILFACNVFPLTGSHRRRLRRFPLIRLQRRHCHVKEGGKNESSATVAPRRRRLGHCFSTVVDP